MKLTGWLRRGALALAGTALLAPLGSVAQTDLDNGQSTFVAPDQALMFGFTVPADAPEDTFISLRVPLGIEWGAVGFGSSTMAGSLVLVIYPNAAGDNVTLSPRVARGNYEPEYYPDFAYDVLPGTGLFDGAMVMKLRCRQHCRSWPGGYIDPSDANQKAIYAVGPAGFMAADAPDAALRMHEDYGRFIINMQRTQGAADAPELGRESFSEGTTLLDWHQGLSDSKAVAHGVLMVFAFVGLLPLGVLILRVGGWVRWHAANQVLAMVVVVVAMVLGILSALFYQRSRSFKDPHQVIGFVLVAFMFVQFAMGFMGHRESKRTQQPSKLARPHVWLGRFIILFAIINAFLGLNLALNNRYRYILLGLCLVIFPVCFIVVFYRDWSRRRAAARQQYQHQQPYGGPPSGYDPEPWRHNPPPAYGVQQQPPPAPPYAPQQQVGLADLDAQGRAKERSTTRVRDEQNMGPAQQPRELV